jgi:hypothetical protein
MTEQHPPLVQRLRDKLTRSRDFSISLVIHFIIIVLLGGVIITKVVPEQDEIIGSIGPVAEAVRPESSTGCSLKPELPLDQLINPKTSGNLPPIPISDGTTAPVATLFTIQGADTLPPSVGPVNPSGPKLESTPSPTIGELTPDVRKQLMQTLSVWKNVSSTGKRAEYEFTAFIGQYSGGNWNSTVRVSNGKIDAGSLPNLLYLMSTWTKDRVRTNYTNVRAIRLDSDELLTVRPPFIFLTGTRDFQLTEKEVENLRAYLKVGGCIWGDSSVPGQRSRFDLAFKREMRRVVADVDKNFEPLPADHPLYAQAYFKDVKQMPAGLNNYRLPIYAMKMYGEVAILYTANDYGDMWQVGLDHDGKIDLGRNADGQYTATNPAIYDQREVYIRNIDRDSLEASYRFGANVVMHLLTRWQSKVGEAASSTL